MKKGVLRIIDVNLNRSREGLRVCEDVVRFILNNKELTDELKNARHRIQSIARSFPGSWKTLICARDSRADVGRGGKRTFLLERKRRDIADIFFANMQRAKESVRVLEEFLKLYNHKLSNRFKRLRFYLYEIERKALKKL